MGRTCPFQHRGMTPHPAARASRHREKLIFSTCHSRRSEGVAGSPPPHHFDRGSSFWPVVSTVKPSRGP